MKPTEFKDLLVKKFKHPPTAEQDICLQALAQFVVDKKEHQVFLLKGYAGTGKTTLVGAFVSQLWNLQFKYVLLAPTGRAAKVIGNYSGKQAQTIHRHIYYPKKTSGGGVSFTLKKNKFKNTVFIIDEASMVPDIPADSKLFENGSLLNDLLAYVDAGINCKILFVGDTAQLPPVKSAISPALDQRVLEFDFNKEVTEIQLTEVVRQASDSGILFNATEIRGFVKETSFGDFQFEIDGFPDLIRLQEGNEIIDALQDSYSDHGHEGTVIVVRSNKRANLYNQQIRQRILFNEHELSVGDYLMVVKNNYYWLDTNSEAGFIANGDIVEVLSIYSFIELYTFRFAKVSVRMVDYPNMKPFDTVLLLDTISMETPSLTYEDSNRLYQEVIKDYASESSKYKKFTKVKENEYFNALQVKFSYAVTCHKSQGGQWPHVYIEQPYLPDGTSPEYFRWLYTALTRAQEKAFLIGFGKDFFNV